MGEESIEAQLREMIVEKLALTIEPSAIGDEDNLTETIDLDSVRLFEVIIGLEEVFGITFEDDEFTMETFSTVKSIAEQVRAKLG